MIGLQGPGGVRVEGEVAWTHAASTETKVLNPHICICSCWFSLLLLRGLSAPYTCSRCPHQTVPTVLSLYPQGCCLIYRENKGPLI